MINKKKKKKKKKKNDGLCKDLEMERNAGVRSNAFLASAKRPEILGGFRNDIVIELDDDSTFKLSAYGDV